MANSFPVMRTGWLISLAPLFRFSNEIDSEKFEEISLRFFRIFLAIKILLPFAFKDGLHGPLNFRIFSVITIIFLAGLHRYYLFGISIIFVLSFYELWLSWPFTINHSGLELGILFLICLMPNNSSRSQISVANMLKILMLSVWFFSGVHKIIDGYYLNAELFSLEVLSNNTQLGHSLNRIINSLSLIFGSVPLSNFSCCKQAIIAFSTIQSSVLLSLSWLTILAEIFLPFSLLNQKFRSIGVFLIFITQGIITFFSGEIDFAFTAFAIHFLFISKFSIVVYPCLICLYVVIQPWT